MIGCQMKDLAMLNLKVIGNVLCQNMSLFRALHCVIKNLKNNGQSVINAGQWLINLANFDAHELLLQRKGVKFQRNDSTVH